MPTAATTEPPKSDELAEQCIQFARLQNQQQRLQGVHSAVRRWLAFWTRSSHARSQIEDVTPTRLKYPSSGFLWCIRKGDRLHFHPLTANPAGNRPDIGMIGHSSHRDRCEYDCHDCKVQECRPAPAFDLNSLSVTCFGART